ncbi:A/G-specific adenine glycosylase [Coxiella endosymbiont of Amblyomma sculptum]|uniref:A/G-specific adenine glycosylase n=1 Tax=Coxiella endosymbiont of Amblyomma sculptum TaxID=2487929 RepID=UPI00132F3A7A|nr:A/G-specific adenine glycosylase [Coxiella endosymbiont of Amblyomma sculptum]QHG92569.1 A/G-specific adenine glycosylase [Coxiella endosymbiont of Amblyomma sculptum]
MKDVCFQKFAQLVLYWFKYYGRHDLPWKKDTTPYRVWISEVMLQQTRVTTVIPYFERFVQQFPTLKILSVADVDEVLIYWSGLGYYARAHNLHRTAQIIYKQYHGKFPTTIEKLTALPGIGRSTAGAILSFGMHRYAVLLDSNVKRVLSRYFDLNVLPKNANGINLLWSLAKKCTPQKHCWDYNQAIMDLGAIVCTRVPKCLICPLQDSCFSYQKNTHQIKSLVEKPKRNRLQKKSIYLIVLQNFQGHIFLEKRPLTGIWGGLWSFPECPVNVENLELWCHIRFNIDSTTKIEWWNPFLHKLSHLILEINPILLKSYTKDSYILAEDKSEIWYKDNFSLPGGIAAPIARLIRQLKQK